MDVLLLKDVERLGKEGAVVRVKPGYARNFLVPRGLALSATTQNLRAVEEQKRLAGVRAARRRKQAEQLKQTLETLSLTLKLSVGEQDTPFGSISVIDILQALSQEQITVEKPMIQLAEPIKALGIYDVPIRVHPEVTATLKVWVVKA